METLIGSVPDSWHTRTLADCCDIQPGPSGTTLKPADHIIGGIPVVNARDVGPNGINLSPGVSVTFETAERLERYRLRRDDIVVVRVGATNRYATVTKDQDGWLLGGSCIRIRAQSDVSPAFLACYLNHPAILDWLADHTQRGVLSTLNARTIGTLPIAIPPAEIQRGVVEVARIIDTKIAAHRSVIQATQRLRELLLPRLLAGDPVAPDPGPCDQLT